jgi:ribosomal protein L29
MSGSFKELSTDEIRKSLDDLRSESLRLRIQKMTGQLLNTASITKNRKDVARAMFELSKRK